MTRPHPGGSRFTSDSRSLQNPAVSTRQHPVPAHPFSVSGPGSMVMGEGRLPAVGPSPQPRSFRSGPPHRPGPKGPLDAELLKKPSEDGNPAQPPEGRPLVTTRPPHLN